MVSGFHPNPSAEEHDADVARTLVRDLERGGEVSAGDASLRPWGVLSSLVAGFVSLGAMPIILWHDRFRDFVNAERLQLRRFAEWLRLHSSRPETMDLRVAGDDLGTRPLLSTLSCAAVVGVVVLFAAQLGGSGPIVERILANTYRFDATGPWRWPITDPKQQIFVGWSVGLAVAYLFHWVQVQAHVSDVRRVVNHANRVFKASGLPGVPVPRVGLGIGPLWLIAGALLASKGAWWGFSLALSGAVQHRYMAKQSLRLRRALAARVREMSRMPVGESEPARFTGSARRCPHVRCLAPLSSGARFCPRCGHNVANIA